MKSKLFALSIFSLFFAACVGTGETSIDIDSDTDDDDGEIADVEQELVTCVTPPSTDNPSATASLTIVVGGGEFASGSVERTSPDTTYASTGDLYFVTEIAGFEASTAGTERVYAAHAEPPTNTSNCATAVVTADFICYSSLEGCWYECGYGVGVGQAVTIPFSGTVCKAEVGMAVPFGVTKVRVKAKASTSNVAKKVKEGGFKYL